MGRKEWSGGDEGAQILKDGNRNRVSRVKRGGAAFQGAVSAKLLELRALGVNRKLKVGQCGHCRGSGEDRGTKWDVRNKMLLGKVLPLAGCVTLIKNPLLRASAT